MSDDKRLSGENIMNQHEFSGKYIHVDGIKTFVFEKGNGEAVLCIHGVPTSSFIYRKLINALAVKGHRGVSIDLPGLGLSSRPSNFDYSFQGFSRFLVKAANELNITKFHLVVHDIGGPIGFALATTHPQRVSSLTILNTWIDVVNYKKPVIMRPFEKNILGEAELAMISHATWPVMFGNIGVNNKDAVAQAEVEAYVDLLKREDNGNAFLKIMRNFDNSEQFRNLCYAAVQQVPYPVQAIWGKDDPALTYERYGKEIKEVAGLKKVHLLSSRHFLQEEVYEDIADLIDRQIK